MSTQHLSAVKSSELRNRRFHELGAIKLAVLWVLQKLNEDPKNQRERQSIS